jgi:hypothetical protein
VRLRTDPRIFELGFSIETECKLLGFTVNQEGDMYRKNFELMTDKVKKTLNFWKIFNLSLSGKITVVKSLVYPIMNYYLSVLVPTQEWLANIETMIENFVVQNLNFSREKIYYQPEDGGLGLFKPELFFKALKVTWVKRCIHLTHDNWRRKMFSLQDPDFTGIQPDDLGECGPLLTGILSALIDFRTAYGTTCNNCLFVPILNNKAFFFKEEAGCKFLNKDDLALIFPQLGLQRMKLLCWADTGNLQSINQISRRLGTTVMEPG